MRTQIGLALAGLLLCAQAAAAQPPARKDLQVFNDVATSVNHYDRFTIFDDVSAEVKNGVVTLEGTVSDRRSKYMLEEMVDNVPGVKDVENRLRIQRGDESWAQGGGSTSSSGASAQGRSTSGMSSSGLSGSNPSGTSDSSSSGRSSHESGTSSSSKRS